MASPASFCCCCFYGQRSVIISAIRPKQCTTTCQASSTTLPCPLPSSKLEAHTRVRAGRPGTVAARPSPRLLRPVSFQAGSAQALQPLTLMGIAGIDQMHMGAMVRRCEGRTRLLHADMGEGDSSSRPRLHSPTPLAPPPRPLTCTQAREGSTRSRSRQPRTTQPLRTARPYRAFININNINTHLRIRIRGRWHRL